MKQQTNDDLINLLVLFTQAQKENLLVQLSELFFTPEEQLSFANRFLIVKNLLQAEKTQREISKELGVSIANITRGSNELKRIDKKLSDFLVRNTK